MVLQRRGLEGQQLRLGEVQWLLQGASSLPLELEHVGGEAGSCEPQAVPRSRPCSQLAREPSPPSGAHSPCLPSSTPQVVAEVLRDPGVEGVRPGQEEEEEKE